MLSGINKLAALSSADLFVLPSFSEGFSIAVLEAMACKLPVILTPQCNFPEAVAANAAVEVEPNAESTREGLEVLLQMTDLQRAEMGTRGYQLVGEKYSWEQVAKSMIEVYQWCLDGGNPPATVRLT
jgi:poly(glycerol-phosphate) alpha-glucosyltransferase